MSRFRVPEIPLGFLLASALWVTVFILQSDMAATYLICEPQQNGQHHCTPYHLLGAILWYAGYIFNAATLTAIATGFIAWFTLTLKRSTDRLWEAGEKQFRLAKDTADRQAIEIQDQIDIARIASNAAKESADAAVATERARFYAVIEHKFLDCINSATAYQNTPSVDENPVAASNLPMAEIKFKNYGKTPGILIEVGTAIVLSERPPDAFVFDVKVVQENIIGVGDTTESFMEIIQPSSMTLGQAKKVRTGATYIWICGYASYDDVFGERRVHRFLQRLVRVREGFRYVLQSYDHKHYNRST